MADARSGIKSRFFVLLAAAVILAAAAAKFDLHHFRPLAIERHLLEPLEGGRVWHFLSPHLREPDGYRWVHYAQRMWIERTWRIRHTDRDNTPYGRPVHWSSVYAWWLIALGYGHATLWGGDPVEAIEAVAPWSDPILFGLLTLALLAGFRGRLGLPGIAALCFFLACSVPVLADFAYAQSDHHGLQQAGCIGLILAALAGLIGRADPSREVAGRRRAGWFALSGFCGAFSLWIGASTAIVVSGALVAGAVVGEALHAWNRHRAGASPPDGADPAPPDPRLWRVWGGVGAFFSLLFYAIEYLPDHAGMQLEVNHPLHALALLAGGEFLCRATRLLRAGRGGRRLSDILWASGCVAAAALLPAASLLGPEGWHILRTPVTRRVLSHGALNQPFLEASGLSGFPWQDLGVVPLLLALGLAVLPLAWMRRASAAHWQALLGALLPAFAAGFLTFAAQIRWVGLFSSLSACAALAAFLALASLLDRSDERRRRVRLALWPTLVCVAAGVISLSAAAQAYFTSRRYQLFTSAPLRLAAYKISGKIARDARRDGRPPRVMGSRFLDHPLTYLAYNGEIPIVGSRYWENLQGLTDESRFLASTDEEDARRIIRERGITHVLAFRIPVGALVAHQIATGSYDRDAAKRTLGARLCSTRPTPPPWLELDETLRPEDWETMRPWVFRVNPALLGDPPGGGETR